MKIRELRPADNAAIETVIRDCLIEFGGDRAGLAWEDEILHHLSDYYDVPARRYWVIEADGRIVGGCGIGSFAGFPDVCELQKMYLLKEARGTGIALELLRTCLEFARQHYKRCYLETLQNMHAANRFYAKHGFQALDVPLEGSEHFACDAWYIKDL